MKQKVEYQHQQETREDTQKLNQSITLKLKLEKELILSINGERNINKFKSKTHFNRKIKVKNVTSTQNHVLSATSVSGIKKI